MNGRIIVVDDYRVAWEYRDTKGNCRHGIADNFFEAENQLAETEKKYNNKCEFFPLQGPPSPPEYHNGGGSVLCKFGPGGDYVTEYTPKTSRSLWTAPAWMTRMLSRAWAALRSRL